MKPALEKIVGAAVALAIYFAGVLALIEVGVVRYQPALAYISWGFAVLGWSFPDPFLRPFKAAWRWASSVRRAGREG